MTALQMTPDEALALAEEKTRGETIHPMSTSLFAIMLVLAEEVRRLRADARRYQWMRQNPVWLGWEHDRRPDEVDAAIDAAMEATNAG